MDFQRNGRCKNLVLLFFLSDAGGFDFSPFYATCIVSSRYKSRKTGVEVVGESYKCHTDGR